ncbi:MAG TPA: type II secretion system F family protein [Chthonomonadales bacterium]|nr:type II secretion system F family protein [Chthonomonadales bacterium]
MEEFAFNGKDRLGNEVSGRVSAADLPAAAQQIRAMGYEPVLVQSAAAVAAAPQKAVPQPQSPVPAAAPLTSQAGTALAEAGEAGAGRMEPWERGGPVPQPPPEPPPAPLTVAQGAPGASAAARSPRAGLSTSPASAITSQVTGAPSLQRAFVERVILPIRSGVVLRDMAVYYRQFATMINAGLPIYQALIGLEGNTSNGALKEVTRLAQRHVHEGGRFSDMMAAQPWIFPVMHVEMVRAAETGGMLDQVFRQLASYVEHEISIRTLISRETLYPKITLFVALMLLGRPGFAVPPVPAFSQWVLGGMGKSQYTTGNYLADTVGFGLVILFPIVAAAIIFKLFLYNAREFREAYDSVKLRIPIVGGLIRTFLVAKFVRTFAALYRGGFSIPTSLEISGESSGNWELRKVVAGGVRRAQSGGLVSDALRGSGFFPAMALDMFRTGELTGNLDEILDKVADHYEDVGKTKSHQVALIFSVLVFLLVALLVGSAIVSFYMSGAGLSTGGASGA